MRTTRLLITIASIEMLLGIAAFILRNRLLPDTPPDMIRGLPAMAAALMVGGAGLFNIVQQPLTPITRRIIGGLSAIPLAMLSLILGLAGVPSVSLHFGVLALGAILSPWFSTETREQDPDLFNYVLGGLNLTVGALFVLAPSTLMYTKGLGALEPVRPVIGFVGLLGAAALLPQRSGQGLWHPEGLLRQAVGVAMPCLLAVSAAGAHVWSSAIVWSCWVFASLMGGTLRTRRHARLNAVPPPHWDPFPALLEATLANWTWLMAILVVIVTTIDGASASGPPVTAGLFVLAVSVYTVFSHILLPNRDNPEQRVERHLTFLTMAMSLLLVESGHLGELFLAAFISTAPLAARASGPAAGRRVLTVATGLITLTFFHHWLSGDEGFGHALLHVLLQLVALHGIGRLGLRSNEAERRLLEELTVQRDQLEAALVQARRADEAVRASEERFRSAFDHAPIGMALTINGGWVLQANRALCDMLGYSADELKGISLYSLTHPDDLERSQAKGNEVFSGQISSYQIEKRYFHKQGHVVWALLAATAFRPAGGSAAHFIVQIVDITGRKRSEEQLIHLATYDPLTDLMNRRAFHEELERHIARAERDGGKGAVLFLDLDQFKYVNDSLGHQAGDALLRSLADVLRRQLREGDLLARLGGDEFAFLLPSTSTQDASSIARQVLAALREHMVELSGTPVVATASIGIAIFPDDGRTAEAVLSRADAAMYTAKERGRNRFATSAETRAELGRAEAKLTWERRIREALAEDRLLFHCQPILNLQTGKVEHHELLLRMQAEDGRLIPPGEFLPIAERFGLIQLIDRWVVQKAIGLIAEAARRGEPVIFEVNLSARSFDDPELLATLRERLVGSGIDPSALVLEITETAAVADFERAREFMETLRSLGCRFAIDDFGAGFSSFSYLKQLPVDYLKLDGSFIRNMAADKVDQQMVRAMVELARGLGKETIAEFVEDEETLKLLREYGVNFAQGYHVGRPRPMGG